MLSNFQFSRIGVSRVLGIPALLAILFVAGCAPSAPPPLAVTTSSSQLPTVIINAAYPSTTLTAANGTAPYTWVITSGALPNGMALSPAGVVSGTPTAFGTFNFTVTVTDSATPTAHTATASLSVQVNPTIASVGLNPATVVGGTASTATVTLNGAAAAAASVTLSSNSASATVPATVTVAAGATTATFQVTTTAVSASTPAIITATYGVAKTATLTMNAPTVSSVALALSTVTGGVSTTGTVTLTGPAATGGDSVTLASNNAAAQVPANITVAAGATTAQFTVTTSVVSSNATATIQASFNSSTQFSSSLTVVPAPSISSFTPLAASITAGGTTKLTAVFSNGTGSVNNSVGTVTSGTATTVQPNSTTTYTLTVTNAAGTSVTQQTTVTVVPAPAITTFTSATATITAGTSTTITGVFSGGTGNVDNGVGVVTSGNAVTVSPAITTTYTLTVSNAATTPATATKTVTVTVVPAPAITSFTPALATIVSGNSTTLTAVFSNGTGTVDHGVGAVTSGTPVSISPTSTTTYTLTVTNAATTPASVTSTTSVTVDTPPGISSAATTTFTVGSNGTFTVLGAGNPVPSLVQTGALPTGVSFIDNGNGTGTLHGIPASGTDAGSPYHFTITASNGVNPAFVQNFTLNVVLVQAPAITAQPTSQTVTVGSNPTFTAAASGAPVPTVQWQVSTNGGTTFTNMTNQTNVTLNLTAVTISQNANQYRAVFTNSVNSATTNAATLTVVPAPTITSFTPGAATITNGTSTTLTAVFNAGAGGNGSVDNSVGTVTTGTAVSVSPTSTTTYTLTVTNAAGTSITQQTTVSVVPAPSITSFVSGASTITQGTSTTLTAVFNAGTGITASIDNSVGTVTSGVGVSVQPTSTTTYTLTVSNTAGAHVTQQVTITVNTPPGISSNASATFTVGLNGTFTVQGTGTPSPSLLESGTLPNPVTFVDNGNGTATLSGTPASGTQGSYPITITAHNIIGPDFVQSFTLTVNPAIPPCGSGSEAMLHGQYAFTLQGFDASGNVVLIGGVLAADGAGNLTAGAVDMNLNAGVQSNLAIASGSTYTIGSDHRGCMAITTSAGTQNYRFSLGALSGGIASNGHVIDFDTAGPFTTGVLRKQNSAAFSTAQVNGHYAFGVSAAQDNIGSKFAAMGVFDFSSGSVTGGALDFNDYNANSNTSKLDGVSGATSWPVAPIAINSGGSYSVDGTTGRGTLSFTPSGASAVNAFIYVVSSSEVLLVSSDARSGNGLFAGSALQQTLSTFTNSSLSGKSVFHTSKPSNNGSSTTSAVTIGIVTATGASATFSFAGYNNDGGSIQTPTNNTASGTFSVAANGRITLTVGGGGGGNQIPEFYLSSPGNAFILNSGSGAESGLLEAQSATTVSGTFALGNISPQAPGEGDETGAVVFASPNVTGTSDDNSQGSQNPNGAISSTYSVDSTGVLFIPASCTPGTNCEQIGTAISASKIVIFDAKSTKINPKLTIADQ